MNKELLAIFAMASGGLLFSLGGYKWKWARRFVLPVALALCAFFGGNDWWRCLGMMLGMIAAFHLGYGEGKGWLWRAFVGVCFVAPTLFLGFTFWQIITPVLWLAMFWLSNNKVFSFLFKWKVVEFSTGVLIGITVSQFILK